jgi:rod shape-determining protein MreC
MIRWLLLAVLVVLLLNLPESMSGALKSVFRETARPLQRAGDGLLEAGREYAQAIRRIPGLRRANEDLLMEMARLEAERAYWEQVASENEDLRRLLALRPVPHQNWIPARVMARSHDGWWQTVRLSKGSDDGIAPNMPVLSRDGLVGKTVAVSRNTADVLLLSDPAFKVSSRLVRAGSFGVVNGRGPSWDGRVYCRMEFIHRNNEVREGDEVVTSGLGGIFPENLPIGTVDRVYMDDSGLYQLAEIVTRADLSSLRYVFVMRLEEAAGAMNATTAEDAP